MLLSDISVKRPVFATVVNMLLVTFGIVAFFMLSLRQYPDIDPPIVSVSTSYPGASSEIIESKITQILESRISGIEGIKNINSTSRNGRSQITIEFKTTRNIDSAANDVRERVSRALNNLPDQALPPEVFKANDDEDVIAWFVMNSTTMNNLELTDYAKRYVVDRIAIVDGVARVRLGGGRDYSMKVWLDRDAMAARNVTVADIENTLRKENVELPAGEVKSTDRTFNVRIERSYKTPEQYKTLVVGRGDDGYLIRLGDVTEVELTAEDDENAFRGNGKDMVGLGIIKQSKANTLDVVRDARAALKQLQETLPEGTQISDSYDSSVFIAKSIEEVYSTLAIAIALVVLVIYLFLGDVRATFIPAITVPVALVATFTVLLMLDFSINLLTLLALVLAIGLVVDDSIVVLENIYRRIESGESPLLAAYNGAREVGFAVIATTLVLVSVFIPLVFLEGDIGRLFVEFAITVAAAVIFSSIAALTLSPMLCSKILRRKKRASKFGRWLDNGFSKLENRYENQLNSTVSNKFGLLVIMSLAIAIMVGLFQTIPQELAPKEDRGNFFVMVRGAEGASYENNLKNTELVEERLLAYYDRGDLNRVIVRTPGFGGSAGIAIIGMPDWEERTKSTSQVMNEISQELQGLTDIRAFAMMRSGLGGRGLGSPVQFVIQGDTYDELAKWRDIILAEARKNPNLLRLDSDYKETLPQLLININTERASDLGVSVSDIGSTLEAMLGQRRATTYIERGEEYNVLLEGRDEAFNSPSDLDGLYVRSATTQQLIPLSNLVEVNEEATASQLNRYNRMRSITIEANLAEGYTLGQALDFLNKVVKDNITGSVNIDYKGQSSLFKESGSSIAFVMLMAMVVTYLILAAQFESFIHPLVIMLAVPLAALGAMLGLKFTGMTLNIYSQIGLVMLIGLAAKNGILIVEFTNQLRDKGGVFKESLIQASKQRLRPIIMTSFSTIMSAVPLMVASGAGAESRSVIGVVIFFGVAFSTILTLYVIPMAYYWIAKNTGSPLAISNEIKRQEELKKS
ncbi:efflux RND transporter permease subunit [Psychrosphaera sp. B3R10]|uniref:efflux RND transporter permease subunit n=1 Tax=unclassified Psychrosphaera TaxID=2641570 RepID=UPI001C08C2AD|nr:MULTISPECIES: efflux RND transporter permease subunit [unclassified Psychrosphaera]MBU2881215.1 efflux RND transporter permease subunit [Psychrosphaera sp. I2R16]MBU2988320.1 efflux RND transporter permease subunit [Psychrosphaera sp. B3R10]MDO6718530.1 efflux RND transporter permease subunit [Psychrosphaera sp. 1_MG-2023]